uniref:Putative phosphatidylinositol transfer protein sec14 n=1 Tax=Ixodes ricinus TaxID=34613 RepID=A0A147BJY7_IXORI
MSGYVGDLNEKQEQGLKELKSRLSDIWKDEFTDPLLLRWLRAREFDVAKAEKLFRENSIWRNKNGIDSLVETYQCPDVLKRYFPGGMCNHDKEGRPLWIMPTGNGDFKGMLQCVSVEAMVKHVTYQVELIAAEMKKQTEKLGKLVDTFTVVVDYENFSLKQIYCLQVIEVTRRLLVLYENHYPEMLERCIIINAPSFFPVFWRLIRPFLTERTANKMEIFKSEGWQPVILKHVDPPHLPVHWGGHRLGPNGDKRCTDMINPGGEVPIQLYLKNCPKVSADPDAIPCWLSRGQKLDIPVTVEGVGSTLCWRFQTLQGHDVGFGVAHKPKGIAKTKEVLQLSRVKCDQVPQTGQLLSEPGTYTFTFDNSYSWFTKKHLFYVLEVKDYEGPLSPTS